MSRIPHALGVANHQLVNSAIRAFFCLLTAVFFTAGATGQNTSGTRPPPSRKKLPPAPADSPIAVQSSEPLRSTTRLVQLSVIVDDRHGKPITGLSRDDFTVFDNNRSQAVQVFLARETDARSDQLGVLPPDTYSNRLADQSVPMSATVILLDGLNTRIPDQQYARLQVIKFLQQIQPQDRVALYTLGSDLKLLHDFTNDAQSLLAALSQYQGRISPDLAKTAERSGRAEAGGHPARETNENTSRDDMFAPFLNALGASERDFDVRDRVVRTVQALEMIGNHVALLPGRKNLVWVSGSFFPAANLQDVEMNTPNGMLLFTGDLESLARTLNNASLVVYPVDARGLLVGDPNFGAFGRPDFRQFALMDEIAERTGGKAFYDTNDIRGAIRRAVDDSRVSYELGYYPAGGTWDGSFHKVRVKVKQHGAHVRTREGYFAVPSFAITPKLRSAFFDAAATNLLEADGLGVTVRVMPPAVQANAARRLNLSITLEPGDLSVEQSDARWTGSFETLLVQLDDKGVVLSATDDPIQFTLTPDHYRRMTQYGLSYKESLAVAPRAAELRIVVRDTPSGRIGATAVPLARYFPAPKPAT